MVVKKKKSVKERKKAQKLPELTKVGASRGLPEYMDKENNSRRFLKHVNKTSGSKVPEYIDKNSGAQRVPEPVIKNDGAQRVPEPVIKNDGKNEKTKA